jgi:activating signal cointegrator 1
MNGISLWQPWASLCVIGAKSHETRSWPPPRNVLGQTLAIHAAQKWNRVVAKMCLSSPACDVLAPTYPELLRYMGQSYGWYGPHGSVRRFLPLGKIVGLVRVVGFFHTGTPGNPSPEVLALSERERAFGDYSPNRYAWKLADPVWFQTPIRFEGSQRVFSIPNSLVRDMETQIPLQRHV